MSKKIQLSDHFTYGRLLRFVMPSILMILCTSVHTIVDGFLCRIMWENGICCSESGLASADGSIHHWFLNRNRWLCIGFQDAGRGQPRAGKSIFQHADYSDIHWNGDFVCNWFSADTANCNPTGCKGSGDAGEQHSIR